MPLETNVVFILLLLPPSGQKVVNARRPNEIMVCLKIAQVNFVIAKMQYKYVIWQ